MANESIIKAFDRFRAHILDLLEKMKIYNTDTFATKEYVDNNLCAIDKVLVNGTELPIGSDKGVNIDLSDYATIDYVQSDGGKITKILVNGVEQSIDGKTANIKIPEITESDDNSLVYITGVKNEDDDEYYSKNVYMNPSTGLINANIIDANKVYGAIWNDYAEWFEKEDANTIFEPGDICSWCKTGVIKSDTSNNNLIMGVCSDTYGHILGGEKLEDMEQNLRKFVPIGLTGRVRVKVKGTVKIGDYIVPSTMSGIGMVDNDADLKIVVGQALENKDNDEIDRITIRIK